MDPPTPSSVLSRYILRRRGTGRLGGAVAQASEVALLCSDSWRGEKCCAQGGRLDSMGGVGQWTHRRHPAPRLGRFGGGRGNGRLGGAVAQALEVAFAANDASTTKSSARGGQPDGMGGAGRWTRRRCWAPLQCISGGGRSVGGLEAAVAQASEVALLGANGGVDKKSNIGALCCSGLTAGAAAAAIAPAIDACGEGWSCMASQPMVTDGCRIQRRALLPHGGCHGWSVVDFFSLLLFGVRAVIVRRGEQRTGGRRCRWGSRVTRWLVRRFRRRGCLCCGLHG